MEDKKEIRRSKIVKVGSIVAFIALLVLTGRVLIMENSVQPLSGKWAEMLKAKPEELTRYAEANPLHLKNVLLKRQSLSKSRFVGARFDNVVWDDSFAQHATFIDSIFKGGIIHDTSFADSRLINVVFDSVVMDVAEFVNATLENVTFKNCKIYNSDIRNLQPSKVKIENCEISDSRFFQSAMDLEIVNTKIIKVVDFGEAKSGSRIVIKNSDFGRYTDFSKSDLDLLSIESSHLEHNKAGWVKARKVVVKDSDIGIDLGGGTYGTVMYENSKNVVMDDATIGTISIQDCLPGSIIYLGKSKVKTIVLRNCHAKDIILNELVADEVVLTGVQADNFEMPQARIGKLTLQNVSFKNNLDLTGAVAKDIVKHAIEIAPATVIKTEGTNIHLTGKPETD